MSGQSSFAPMPSRVFPSVSAAVLHAQAPYRSKLPILAFRDPASTHYWSQTAEYNGKIINQSEKDGKPRVTNISDDRKLRVGLWRHLDDPHDHEARHLVLANLRKAAPDRVCPRCSYNLKHNCMYSQACGECQECCDETQKLKYKKLEREYREALKRL